MSAPKNTLLSTGSKGIDELLGGGIEKGVLTQIYGPFASGKTTLAMQIGLLNRGKVAYVDTESGFSPERLKVMASSRGLNSEEVLQKFLLFEPENFREQGKIIARLKKVVDQRFSLVVVDSITAHYRVESNKQAGSTELSKQLQVLLWLARKYKIAVIVINQVFHDSKVDVLRPIAEQTLGYKCKDILRLERLERPGVRIALLERHRHKPEGGMVYFKITNKGIEDV